MSRDAETPLPFATATIARIYVEQGKLDEAAAIYRQLLEHDPDDARSRAGLAEVTSRQAAQDAEQAADQVTLALDAGGIVCRFAVSDEGLRRARLVLGGDGQLALRLARFPCLDDAQAYVDCTLVETRGELTLDAPEQTLLVAAAVGLAEGGRFVSIAHTPITPANTEH